jgi:hypothetical protein
MSPARGRPARGIRRNGPLANRPRRCSAPIRRSLTLTGANPPMPIRSGQTADFVRFQRSLSDFGRRPKQRSRLGLFEFPRQALRPKAGKALAHNHQPQKSSDGGENPRGHKMWEFVVRPHDGHEGSRRSQRPRSPSARSGNVFVSRWAAQ